MMSATLLTKETYKEKRNFFMFDVHNISSPKLSRDIIRTKETCNVNRNETTERGNRPKVAVKKSHKLCTLKAGKGNNSEVVSEKRRTYKLEEPTLQSIKDIISSKIYKKQSLKPDQVCSTKTRKQWVIGAMPNYSEIFKKNSEKQEGINEYLGSKEARAALLLSGSKASKSSYDHSLNQVSSPYLKRQSNLNISVPVEKNVDISRKRIFPFKLATHLEKTTITKYSIETSKKNIVLEKTLTDSCKKRVTKKKLVKTVIQKNRVDNHIERNAIKRDLINGVRSNRRFELLMNMRRMDN